MKKEFIPYEQALALKELGFNESCFAKYYQQDGNTPFIQIGEFEIEEAESAGDDVTFECDVPLFSQAFRWFREKYGYDVSILRRTVKAYKFEIQKLVYEGDDYFFNDFSFDNHEEAELECLKKLIEIVKTKEIC